MKFWPGFLLLCLSTFSLADKSPFDLMPAELVCPSGDGDVTLTMGDNGHYVITYEKKTYRVTEIAKKVEVERYQSEEKSYSASDMHSIIEYVFNAYADKNSIELTFRKPNGTKVPSSSVRAISEDGKVRRFGMNCRPTK